MATIQTQLRPGGDGGNPVEPPDTLTEVQLISLTASPQSIEPFGAPATIRWNVDEPGGPVGLSLNGMHIAKTGSMQVQPAVTTTYRLNANLAGFTRLLGSVTVGVQTSACLTVSVSQDDVQNELRAAIDAVVAQESRLSQRSPATVTIDPSGINVSVRLSVAIDNFPDPDLDVDFSLGLQMRDGQVEPFYRSFSTDVSWPWWVTTVTLGISKIVEAIVEDRIEGALKPQVLQQVTKVIDDTLKALPSNLKLYRIVPEQGAISVTACPIGDNNVHHVVLGTLGGSLPVLGTTLQAKIATP